MGRSIDQWQTSVAGLIRDVDSTEVSASEIVASGIRLAIAQFSVDRPRTVYAEVAGAGSPYLDLPAGWAPGLSSVSVVEYPARQNPPRPLDSRSWLLVRDPTDVAVEQLLLLGQTPVAGQYVRVAFTARWPEPTDDPDDDLVDDVAFEAVMALAASFCCQSLAVEASRSQHASLPTDWTDSRDRMRDLMEAANAYRATYDRMLGIGSGAGADGAASSSTPASGSFDLDPSYLSLFHGGRR